MIINLFFGLKFFNVFVNFVLWYFVFIFSFIDIDVYLEVYIGFVIYFDEFGYYSVYECGWF